MAKIAVVGPGAIGGTVATWLSNTGMHEVTLCARRILPNLQLDHPDGTSDFDGKIVDDRNNLETVDWILVATKAYDSDVAASWFSSLSGPQTRLAVLQNGVDHIDRFKDYFNVDGIVPVIVDIPAERDSLTHILQRRSGSLTVSQDDNGTAFTELFENTCFELLQTTDLVTAAWKKLCINAAGVVSALTMRPAEVVHEMKIADLAKGIVGECAAVGRAEGAQLPDDIAASVIEGYQSAPPESINSLHGDRIAGKLGEVDARNGVIVRLGKIHGIATPLNTMAVALLEHSANDRVS